VISGQMEDIALAYSSTPSSKNSDRKKKTFKTMNMNPFLYLCVFTFSNGKQHGDQNNKILHSFLQNSLLFPHNLPEISTKFFLHNARIPENGILVLIPLY